VIAAQGIAFDRDTLEAPAGKPFTIEFQNDDAGTSHNVAIYTDSAASTQLFVGEIFPGAAARTYSVPALDPGTYFFRCDVHPTQMTGTVLVG
jgi:plastocyanin